MVIRLVLLLLSAFAVSHGASAHEVYVLPPSVVAEAIREPAFSETSVIESHMDAFVFWAFIAILVVVGVFLISITRSVEDALDPFLVRLPRYAPLIGRVTLALSFLAAAYFGALFGPELPLADSFGAYALIVRALLVLVGLMLLAGWYVRVAALGGLALFLAETAVHGTYLLTYTNYLGELLLLLILGAHAVGVHGERDDERTHAWLRAAKARLVPLAFPLLRVGFGVALIYASLYAKVIHNQLALAVTVAYPDIAPFFGFSPDFLVLGAAIIEVLIGLFFVIGFEIRFTALFLLFWLSLSLWYFGEVVWPHLILIGIPLAFICYGYDRYSVEGALMKHSGREPVL